jgi:hypothetical protein
MYTASVAFRSTAVSRSDKKAAQTDPPVAAGASCRQLRERLLTLRNVSGASRIMLTLDCNALQIARVLESVETNAIITPWMRLCRDNIEAGSQTLERGPGHSNLQVRQSTAWRLQNDRTPHHFRNSGFDPCYLCFQPGSFIFHSGEQQRGLLRRRSYDASGTVMTLIA